MVHSDHEDSCELLGAPVRLPFSGKTARNRIWKSGMTERLSTFSDSDEMERGRPTSSYQRLYSVFGSSGAGILVTGNIMVQRSYLEAKGNAIVSYDLSANDSAFRDVARAAKCHGSLILGQLCHPGYQANPPVPATRICVSLAESKLTCATDSQPSPLKPQDITAIVEAFAHAARVLHDAGFDGIQLHGAYGHLITQFWSPAINKRDDGYGGSSENRMRFLFEIIAAIRAVVNDEFIISLKVNSLDFIKCGFPEQDAKVLAEKLEYWRVDVLEISGGAYEFPSALKQIDMTRERHAKFEEFTRTIAQHLTKTVVVINGGLRSATRMADVVRSGMGSFVGLARVLCAEPALPTEILSGQTKGAKDNKIPASGMQYLGAIHQLRAIGEGTDIPDFSDESTVKAFMETAKWE